MEMQSNTGEVTTPEAEANDLQLFHSLLGGSWDQIEDVKQFVTPPMGTYTLHTTKCEVGMNNDKTQGSINLIAEITGIVELVKPDEVDEAALAKLVGSPTGTGFVGTFGLSKFKEAFGHISAEMGLTSAEQMIEALASGLDIAVTIGHRVDKEKVDDLGTPRIYPSWKTVILA